MAFNFVAKECAAIVFIARRLGCDHQFAALKQNLDGHKFIDGEMEAVATSLKFVARYEVCLSCSRDYVEK